MSSAVPSLHKGAAVALQVPGDASGGHVTITCHFNQTGSTEVQVTPAAVAQQSSAGLQAPEAHTSGDLIDDFAAGDAAAQIPVGHAAVSELELYLNPRQDCTPLLAFAMSTSVGVHM